MKFDISLLTATAAVLFQATGTMAGDTFTVINTKDGSDWKARAVWNRGNANDIRPISAHPGCRHWPHVPWPEVNDVCWDWTNNRGHIRVGNNYHCFAKKYNSEVVIHPNYVTKSIWETVDCTWATH